MGGIAALECDVNLAYLVWVGEVHFMSKHIRVRPHAPFNRSNGTKEKLLSCLIATAFIIQIGAESARISKCQVASAYFLALRSFLQRRERDSGRVCLKDGRPCSDWFMTDGGREGFTRDARQEMRNTRLVSRCL